MSTVHAGIVSPVTLFGLHIGRTTQIAWASRTSHHADSMGEDSDDIIGGTLKRSPLVGFFFAWVF
ncbi:MAG TPA: hypothetical protein VF663_12880, partial [Telluria sp.]